MDRTENLSMTRWLLKTWHLMLVHLDETFLEKYILEGKLLQKKRLYQFKEPAGIEFQEPLKELLCGYKPDNIENIHSPFEYGESASRKLFALEEQPDNPH